MFTVDTEQEMIEALQAIDNPMVQTEEFEVEEYLALLTDEPTDEALTALENAEGTEQEDSTETRIELVTTAPVGDMDKQGAITVDSQYGTFNGKVLRLVSVLASDLDVQRKTYESAGHIGMPADKFDKIYGGVQSQGAIAEQATITEGAEVAAEPEVEAEETATQELEIPQEILDAEALAQAAKDMQVQYAVLQAQMKLQAEQLKVLQAQAAIAKAKAPVLITPELRIKLDTLAPIIAGGEQSIAKAIQAGLLYVKIPGSAKKDTGTIRSVPRTPSSTGVVEMNHHGSSATSVNGKPESMSPEKRAAIVRIKALLAQMPAGVIADSAVARQAGLDAKQGSKLVWHIRNGSYADIS